MLNLLFGFQMNFETIVSIWYDLGLYKSNYPYTAFLNHYTHYIQIKCNLFSTTFRLLHNLLLESSFHAFVSGPYLVGIQNLVCGCILRGGVSHTITVTLTSDLISRLIVGIPKLMCGCILAFAVSVRSICRGLELSCIWIIYIMVVENNPWEFQCIIDWWTSIIYPHGGKGVW